MKGTKRKDVVLSEGRYWHVHTKHTMRVRHIRREQVLIINSILCKKQKKKAVTQTQQKETARWNSTVSLLHKKGTQTPGQDQRINSLKKSARIL